MFGDSGSRSAGFNTKAFLLALFQSLVFFDTSSYKQSINKLLLK